VVRLKRPQPVTRMGADRKNFWQAEVSSRGSARDGSLLSQEPEYGLDSREAMTAKTNDCLRRYLAVGSLDLKGRNPP
jgi:hypothetical protein